MSEADTFSVSRRQFLAGCGAVGAATAGAPVVDAAQDREAESSMLTPAGNPVLGGATSVPGGGGGGDISPEGQARIAAVDRQFERERPKTQKTLHAVDDLGLDPSGNKPINGTLESKVSGLSNTRIEFPSDGTFTVTEKMVVQPNGPIELSGNGCTIQLKASSEHKILIFEAPSWSLLKGFTFSCTSDTSFGFQVETDGTARVEDITVKGYMRSDQSKPNRVQGVFAAVARSSSATVQVRNLRAIGGTPAGVHDQSDKPESALVNQIAAPMGVWVGQQTQGTVQLIECQLRGWSNAVYGGRTHGRVEVSGGTYYNNINSQLRLGGGSVVDGATLVLDDRQWSMKENPGPYSLGEQQGVYAIRVDAKHGNTSDPIKFKNVEIQAKSMNKGGSVIDFESESGPGIFKNCKIMNHLDRPVIMGESPSVGGPTNIVVDQCLIGGNSPATVMQMQNRPQSRISNTCITIPNAGPDDIQGAQIGKGVSYGNQCKTGSGLSKPKKVGSGGNISSLPAPNVSYNGSSSTGSSASGGGVSPAVQQAKQKGIVNTIGVAVLLVLALVVTAFVGPIVALWEFITGE